MAGFGGDSTRAAAPFACIARSRHATVYKGITSAGAPYCLKIISSLDSVPLLPQALERLARVQHAAGYDAAGDLPVPHVISFGPVHRGARAGAPHDNEVGACAARGERRPASGGALGAYYLVSSWLPGNTVAAWMRCGDRSLHERAQVACAVAACVADLDRLADGAAFLHLDIKPSNIVLAPRASGGWRARLVDLETVLFEDMHPRTAPSTPCFAAPEVFDPATGVLTAAADVFACARVLQEVLRTDAAGVPAISYALDPVPERRPAARDLAQELARWASRAVKTQ